MVPSSRAVMFPGLLSQRSETLLVFFSPQVLNFLLSCPQLFKIIPCPRHRLPSFDPKTGLLTGTKDGTLVNLFLRYLGKCSEKSLCIRLLILQLVAIWATYMEIHSCLTVFLAGFGMSPVFLVEAHPCRGRRGRWVVFSEVGNLWRYKDGGGSRCGFRRILDGIGGWRGDIDIGIIVSNACRTVGIIGRRRMGVISSSQLTGKAASSDRRLDFFAWLGV
ncbi:hypothetical protein M5K25_010821 [Dendrobium thyrsiflorum]|uniref:UDP-N-acetylglucosamine--dolichyl-phosphate N-acetylglucosaminephosphotransferase n=1 Tax=Dendrobium thyrsiflorum TaxID=117978 RepID=A0ABD0V8C2_DENTH